MPFQEHAITAATGTLMSLYLFDDGVTPITGELAGWPLDKAHNRGAPKPARVGRSRIRQRIFQSANSFQRGLHGCAVKTGGMPATADPSSVATRNGVENEG